ILTFYQLTQKTTPLGVVEWDIPCGILVCSMHGYTSFRPWGLQNAVPCRVDTEIPQANPESWACGLFAARARKDPAGDAGRGDRRDQCPAGSCPRGDGDSSEVRGFGRDRKAEGTVGLCPAQEVRLARQGVLERERRLVARIFRLDRRHRRETNSRLRQIPARTGFRSSEARSIRDPESDLSTSGSRIPLTAFAVPGRQNFYLSSLLFKLSFRTIL